MNFAGGDWNPASLKASVSVGSDKINLNQASATDPSQGSAPQGLYYQAIFILIK